jgi:UDP-N-acetylglucosamine 2-epimerase (non-hydrolysing)
LNKKVVIIAVGTRPEAIKMAPVYLALKDTDCIDVKFVNTGQHSEMIDQVLEIFAIEPDIDLDVMRRNSGLNEVTGAIINKMEAVIEKIKPDLVMVHGDTATTLAVSLASYFARIPVWHVEAGLRTGDIYSPWPEEVNRRVAGVIADIHLAPTETAKQNLLREGESEHNICVTGNTVIDALQIAAKKIEDNKDVSREYDERFGIDRSKDLVLVTGHRRESFGAGFKRICEALVKISNRQNTYIIYPVHLNPNVFKVVHGMLGQVSNISLISPVNYLEFIHLMQASKVILTDSGGVQEEAPSLGKPVLVMRDTTERPEAVNAGTVKLVGANVKKIYERTLDLLEDTEAYEKMARAHNPYGDGKAAQRIKDFLVTTILDS